MGRVLFLSVKTPWKMPYGYIGSSILCYMLKVYSFFKNSFNVDASIHDGYNRNDLAYKYVMCDHVIDIM